MTEKKPKHTIGRSTTIDLPELGCRAVPVRIDTGARTSALGAQSVTENPDGGLDVVFFVPGNPFYTGKVKHFTSFGQTEVRSSNGHTSLRYTIRTRVVLSGRTIRATFTLADRSTQLYPVLIGRNVLRGKFIVDVKLGTSIQSERQRNRALKIGQSQKEGS